MVYCGASPRASSGRLVIRLTVNSLKEEPMCRNWRHPMMRAFRLTLCLVFAFVRIITEYTKRPPFIEGGASNSTRHLRRRACHKRGIIRSNLTIVSKPRTDLFCRRRTVIANAHHKKTASVDFKACFNLSVSSPVTIPLRY